MELIKVTEKRRKKTRKIFKQVRPHPYIIIINKLIRSTIVNTVISYDFLVVYFLCFSSLAQLPSGFFTSNINIY